MPQKPNRKDMQPYVASGEHGGEYTDYAAGTPYSQGYKPKKKKEDKSNNGSNPTINLHEQDLKGEVGFQAKNRGKSYEKVANHIDNNSDFTPEQKQYIRKIVSQGDDECNKLLADAQIKMNTQYQITKGTAYCSGLGDRVAYAEEDISKKVLSSSYSGGDTFYHENGHMIDHQNGIVAGPLSGTYVSKKHNSTLHDMITKETRKLKDVYLKLKEIKDAYISEQTKDIIAKNKPLYDEVDNYLNKLDEEKSAKLLSGRLSWEEENKIYNEYNTKVKEYRNSDIYKKYREAKKEEFSKELAGTSKFDKEYGNVCDMLSSRGYNLGMGHRSSYWKRSLSRGKEFFAEAFAEIATDNNGHLKEFFPNSFEIVEEILRSLKK